MKSLLQAAGLSIPLTICDVAPAFAASPELRAAVEVTMTNTFPFWEGIAIENAVADLQEDLGWLLMQAESQGKPFVLGETGWPSAGFIEGVGIASPSSQARYFAEGFCRVDVENQWDYYWFTGIDNAWRREQDPENTIEGNWGFMYANRTLKSHFEDFSFQCSNGVTYSFSEVDWSIPDMTAPPTPLNPASCAAHSACDGLLGNCCPGDNGLVLLCCDQDISPTANAPSISPVLSSNATNVTTAPAPSNSSRAPQTTTFPTKSPSASPTLAPSEITNAQTASPSSSDPTTLPTPSPSIPVPTQDDSTPEPTPWFTNSTFEPSGNYTTNSTFEPSSSPPLRSPTPRPSVDVVFRPSGGNTADSLVSSGPLRNAGLLALACVITVLATTGRLF